MWHPVPAAVLRRGAWGRPTVLDVGVPLAVRLRPGHEEIIARTGRAWLITGPRTTWLRVDGSHAVFGGRRTRAVPGAVHPVDDDPFTPAVLDGRALRRATVALVAAVAAWLPFVPLASGWPVENLLRNLVMIGVIAAGLGPLVVGALPAMRVMGRPDPDGWTWVSATMAPWTATGDVPAKTRGVATLPDGTRLRVRLPAATADFLGTVWEAGGFWVAGTPAPGRVLVAGFPHAPLAAPVRFSSRRR
ncbi:hypothetical protein [Actinokineospora sp. NPDC004072]